MTTPANGQNDANVIDIGFAPVRKSIQVQANINDAFETFTEDMDSWWPRSHHIGKSPMTKLIFETRQNGRCYSEQEDGTECDWGTVLAWEPPKRVLFAWQITAAWQFEPEIAKSSEVEVRFTALGDALTRVDLEHRKFERLGEGGRVMRAGVDDASGWNGLLVLYTNRAERRA